MDINVFKVAKAMTPFTADNKSRALQQKDILANVRELTTRIPELNFLRKYRQHNFDIELADVYEPTPNDGDRSTHAPTETREGLTTVFALIVKGNAAAIVQDADDATNGVAIFCKLVKAYGQTDGDCAVYLLQLRQIPFYEAGGVTVFTSKFFAICNDFHNTTGTSIPTGVQRTSLLNAIRTRDIIGTDGATLAVCAPGAPTPLHQSFIQQRLSIGKMLRMLETTCENILSADPDALIQTKDSSALALVSFDICTSCKGTDRATKHTSHKRDDTRTRPSDWSQFTDRNKRAPDSMKKPASGIRQWCDKHKHWGAHSTEAHHGQPPGRNEYDDRIERPRRDRRESTPTRSSSPPHPLASTSAPTPR